MYLNSLLSTLLQLKKTELGLKIRKTLGSGSDGDDELEKLREDTANYYARGGSTGAANVLDDSSDLKADRTSQPDGSGSGDEIISEEGATMNV